MANETVINTQSSVTQVNTAVNSIAANTIVNSALYNLSQIPIGTILCDKYIVVQELSIMGGEASLFLCEAQGQKYVAKLYRRDVAIKDEVTNALKTINSPHVAKLYDTGVYNGLPFEIIPYYKQGSLQGRTFSFEELRDRIIPSLNEGLHELHKNGIIHKDLKPSNIMLCDNEEDVVIIDFGISSVKDSSNTIIVTQTGMTPEYSALETFRNLFLEESDYYSLGITLYELYAGRTPYGGLTSEDEIAQYMSVQRIPFPSNMPTDLCKLIAGLTYNDITHRKNKSNPNRRWTYDEVVNWCQGKYQQIPGEGVASVENQIPPYSFKGQRYSTMPVLVDALAENWEDGKKQLFRGILSSFFKPVDPEIAGYCMDAEDAQADGENPDRVFFKTIYKLCPNTRTFYWRGYKYDSLPDMGNNMLSKLRQDDHTNYGVYDEILARHVISEYVSMKDEGNDKLISAAKSLEDRFIAKHNDVHEKELTYYLTGFMLSGQRTFEFMGLSASSVDELVKQMQALLLKSTTEFQAVCDQLIDSTGTLNEQFEAWLMTLGKTEEIVKWRRGEYGA